MSTNWSYAVHNLAMSKLADLSDYCTAVVNLTEGQGGGKAGSNLEVAYLDGERWEQKTQAPADIVLLTNIRYTSASGTVTDPDGKPGHFMKNLEALHRLLGSHQRRYLVRTAPGIGSQRLLFESLTDPVTGADKNDYRWVLRAIEGSWQDVTESSATGNPPSITTGGNRPIFDPEISFSAAGSFVYTDGSGVQHSIAVAAGPTFPVVVRMVNGEWTATDNNSLDALPFVTVNQPWFVRFDPASTLSISTTTTVTVKWRNRRA